MKKNVYTLILAFLLLGGMIKAQDILLQSFDDPGAIGNWKNSTAGNYTLTGSGDAVEGTGSISINYNLVADQGWGGSVDIQMLPAGGGTFPSLAGTDGVRFWFKAVTPASVTAGVRWNTKLYVNSTGGEEQWHFEVGNVLGDASGEWVKVELPFSSFAIPSWLTIHDGVLYLDKIFKIEMQILANEGTTTTGEVLIDKLTSYKAGGTSVGTLLESFDESGSIGSWQNSTAGSYSLTGSSDAVEGAGSVCLDYILIADQSWGGSIDMQFLPDGATYPDLTGEAGIRFNYKVTQPASVSNGFSLTVKLYVNSTGGEEQWHASTTSVIGNTSGEWEEAKMPFLNFAIPSWLTTYDGVLYLNQITKIEMQIVTGTAGLQTNGALCFDNLTSYNETNVTLYDGYTLNDYDTPASQDTVNSWVNGSGSRTISSVADAMQGDSAVCVSYNLIADLSWGGSVDMQMLPAGDVFPDMNGHLGVSFWYKTTQPASTPSNLAFTIKLFVNSTGGEEQWHKSVGGILGDGSGEWKQVYVPFSSFAIPNWLTTYDGVLYQDKIREIQFQIFGQPNTTTTGSICFDNLISYDDEEVVVDGTVTPIAPDVKIYPNPASSRLTIEGLDNIERIDVYSLNGSYVKRVNGQSFVDVADLRSGFYLLKIYTPKNVYSAKFARQ
jgi:hypothetical protein